jgi:beta-glucanase (GH16 family)
VRSAPLGFLLTILLALPCGAVAAPVRVVAADASVRDALGRVWTPAGRMVDGGRATDTPRGTIARTASPRLYRACRSGVRGVHVPIAGGPGTYGLVLRFLARSDRPRAVHVVAEGRTVARRMLVEGRGIGWPAAFAVVVADGRLDVSLRGAGAPAAALCAIEVRRLSPSTAPMAMRWGDEFLGRAGAPVDDTRWDYYVGVGRPPGWGASELETYTYRPSNVALDGAGALNIVARRERLADPSDGVARDFSSGRLGTDGRFAFTYGLLAARLKVPAGKGIWPAFWLVGNDVDRVGWPAAGEIDVAEVMGSKPSTLYGSVHGPRLDAPSQPYNLNRTTTAPSSLAGDFHVYAVLRLPGAIQLLVDGRPYQAYTAADLGPGRPWVYDKRYRIMLSLAVGGVWDGAPDATTPFPATLSADWIRLTQWAAR